MPRLSKELIKEREEFAVSNFQAGMDMEGVNDALAQKYGMRMNPYRLQELYQPFKPAEVVKPIQEPEPPIYAHAGILDRVVVLDPQATYQTIPQLIADIGAGKYDKQGETP